MRARRLPRLPAAAERAVQAAPDRCSTAVVLVEQRQLVLLQRALGIEHVDEIADPALVALPRQPQRVAILQHRVGRATALLLIGAIGGDRILDFVQRIEHGALDRRAPPPAPARR